MFKRFMKMFKRESLPTRAEMLAYALMIEAEESEEV